MNPSWHSRNGPEELRKRRGGQYTRKQPAYLSLQRAFETRTNCRIKRGIFGKDLQLEWTPDKVVVRTADERLHKRFRKPPSGNDIYARFWYELLDQNASTIPNEDLNQLLMWIAATGGYTACRPAG